MPPVIRIAIADDHAIFREGLYSAFHRQDDLQIVGDASNGEELLNLVARISPDIVLTDIKMPRMDGMEAVKQLKRSCPQLPVIALSMYDDEQQIIEMLEAGATGYLLKDAHKEELFHAVRTVTNHGTYYCSTTSNRLIRLMVQSKFNPYKPDLRPQFTDRETEVIKLLCHEYCNKEIASKLATTTKSIERTRERIQEKIGARNVVGVVVYAIRNRFFLLD